MTDTPEAVRLAYFAMRMQTRLGSCRESCNDYDKMAWDDYDAMDALLRRIPELEAEVQEQARLNGMGAERELALRAQVSRLEAERDQLRAELEKVRVPEGWVPVPIEPTWDMKTVAMVLADREWCYHVGRDDAKKLWSAMLSATPTPPHADQKGAA